MESKLYVSTPWSKIDTRMMDPLGFQWIADRIADELVPGISSRQKDARWLTLLCKGLSGISSTEQERYKRMSQWERGILVFANNRKCTEGRQLPGIRCASTSWPQRYRFYGPYGSYRSLLIKSGLTEGDGWTLSEAGWNLSDLVRINFCFRGNIPVNLTNEFNISWLPCTKDEKLRTNEVRILQPKIFGQINNGEKRLSTLTNLKKIWEQYPVYGWFDAFTRECLNIFKQALKDINPGETLKNFDYDFVDTLKPVQKLPTELEKVAELAQKIKEYGSIALFQHHVKISGIGQRWFEKNGSRYIRVAYETASIRSAYNYRFQALWRLGSQLCPDISGNNPFDNADSGDDSDDY